jgi:hypothetical protein
MSSSTATRPEPRHAPERAASPHTERLQQITAMVTEHDEQLRRVVRRRGSQSPEIVDDACKYAWIQLLTAEHVDLRPPLWEALAWLTSCAVRHARMLSAVQRQLAGTVVRSSECAELGG